MDDDTSSINGELISEERPTGGDNEYNEFIIGADEYTNNGTVLGGGSGSLFMSCGVALLIVVLILVFVKMFSKKGRRAQSMRYHMPARQSCKKHVDTFDNLLIPPSYFDYNAHGTQYINWTRNN